MIRYYLKQRLFSLTNDFTVQDEKNEPVFKVHGKFLHIGDDITVTDIAGGQELVHIKQKVISLLPCYDVYRNGELLVRVNKQFHLSGERFKVTGDNGKTYQIVGNIFDWDFSINDEADNVLGRVNRNLSVFRDSYAVEIESEADVPFIIAMALVIELVKVQRDRALRLK